MIWLWSLAALANDFHVVREGETLTSIAAAYAELDAAALREANALTGEPAVGTLLTIPTTAEHAHQEGYVIALAGTGTLRPPAGPQVALRLGSELPAGSTVCTGPGSFATLRLAADIATGAHDDISLLDETCLAIRGISSLPARRSSTVGLESGSVSVRSAPSDGDLNVVTRDGVTTGNRGGFRVTLEEEASRTEALFAEVAIIGQAIERRVPAGFGARVPRGQAPTELTPLLPPGQPAHPAHGATLRRHDFDWSPVERALGYRVEVSTAPDFSELVMVEEVDAASWRPEFLALPQPARAWWWRVASFDRLGYLGIPSDGQEAREPIPVE